MHKETNTRRQCNKSWTNTHNHAHTHNNTNTQFEQTNVLIHNTFVKNYTTQYWTSNTTSCIKDAMSVYTTLLRWFWYWGNCL